MIDGFFASFFIILGYKYDTNIFKIVKCLYALCLAAFCFFWVALPLALLTGLCYDFALFYFKHFLLLFFILFGLYLVLSALVVQYRHDPNQSYEERKLREIEKISKSNAAFINKEDLYSRAKTACLHQNAGKKPITFLTASRETQVEGLVSEIMLGSDQHLSFISEQIDASYKEMVRLLWEIDGRFVPNLQDDAPVSAKLEAMALAIDNFNSWYTKRQADVADSTEFKVLNSINSDSVFMPELRDKVNNKGDAEKIFAELRNIVKYYSILFKGLNKGADGERRVNEHLDLYKDRVINLPNVRMELEGTSVEADNIVVSENGVFCIETKNYGNENEKIVVTKDGRWRRFRGNEEKEVKNVAEQHNRHVGIMQRFINQELKNKGIDIPYIDFHPIFVIANDAVDIENQSNEIVLLRTSSVYQYMMNHKSDYKIPKDIQAIIKEIISHNNMGAKAFSIEDRRQAFSYYLSRIAHEYKNSEDAYSLLSAYTNEIKNMGLRYEYDSEYNIGRYVIIKK